jgi:hypothetical protein
VLTKDLCDFFHLFLVGRIIRTDFNVSRCRILV